MVDLRFFDFCFVVRNFDFVNVMINRGILFEWVKRVDFYFLVELYDL